MPSQKKRKQRGKRRLRLKGQNIKSLVRNSAKAAYEMGLSDTKPVCEGPKRVFRKIFISR